jgi:hypothetical protein
MPSCNCFAGNPQLRLAGKRAVSVCVTASFTDDGWGAHVHRKV